MAPLWSEAQRVLGTAGLDARLADLVRGGLTVLGGAVVFARCAPVNFAPAAGESLTGVEARVNKIFLDEVVDTERQGWAELCVAQGVLLAERVLQLSPSVTGLPIDVALSVDLGGSTLVQGEQIETFPSSTFRFHVRRAEDPWMSDDLKGFDQPVAVVGTA